MGSKLRRDELRRDAQPEPNILEKKSKRQTSDDYTPLFPSQTASLKTHPSIPPLPE